MGEFKGTNEKWYLRFMTGDGKDDGECDFFIEAQEPKNQIGKIEIMMEDFGEHSGYPREQKLADTKLTIDAGNVRQQINCSLPELLEQRNELLEALQEMVRMYESVQPAGGWQGQYDSSVSAINKTLKT